MRRRDDPYESTNFFGGGGRGPNNDLIKKVVKVCVAGGLVVATGSIGVSFLQSCFNVADDVVSSISDSFSSNRENRREKTEEEKRKNKEAREDVAKETLDSASEELIGDINGNSAGERESYESDESYSDNSYSESGASNNIDYREFEEIDSMILNPDNKRNPIKAILLNHYNKEEAIVLIKNKNDDIISKYEISDYKIEKSIDCSSYNLVNKDKVTTKDNKFNLHDFDDDGMNEILVNLSKKNDGATKGKYENLCVLTYKDGEVKTINFKGKGTLQFTCNSGILEANDFYTNTGFSKGINAFIDEDINSRNTDEEKGVSDWTESCNSNVRIVKIDNKVMLMQESELYYKPTFSDRMRYLDSFQNYYKYSDGRFELIAINDEYGEFEKANQAYNFQKATRAEVKRATKILYEQYEDKYGRSENENFELVDPRYRSLEFWPGDNYLMFFGVTLGEHGIPDCGGDCVYLIEKGEDKITLLYSDGSERDF